MIQTKALPDLHRRFQGLSYGGKFYDLEEDLKRGFDKWQ